VQLAAGTRSVLAYVVTLSPVETVIYLVQGRREVIRVHELMEVQPEGPGLH
jgi:hypothetical protein